MTTRYGLSPCHSETRFSGSKNPETGYVLDSSLRFAEFTLSDAEGFRMTRAFFHEVNTIA